MAAQKKWHKHVDKANGYSTFKCYGCGELSMTPAGLFQPEISSAYARFKQKHDKCKKE